MSKIYIVILTVTVLLPVVCNAGECTDGTATGNNATEFLKFINGYREKLREGNQTNGQNQTLLPAGNIQDVEWDCTLEEELQKDLEGWTCGQMKDKYEPSASIRDAHATEWNSDYYDYNDGSHDCEFQGWKDFLFETMKTIDDITKQAFLIDGEQVKLHDDSFSTVHKYAEWMRSAVTKVACAVKKCSKADTGSAPEYALVCATNQPPFKEGEDNVIYDVAPSTTSTTTTIATTTTTPVAPTTTAPTTLAPTTIAPATAATTKLATTAAKESTGTPCPTYSTTPCPTYSTTPCPTYTTPCPTYPPARLKREAGTANENVFKKKAKFSKATSGENTICSSNKGMTDSLRTLFLNMHNYRRAKLALGEVIGYGQQRLSPAKNMLKLSYACKLEASALRYAAHCPSMRSKANARPNQGENFFRLAKVGFPDFADAVNMTVYNWWDVVRDTPGIDKNAKLQTRRPRSPIVSFTQMAWATTRYLGCSIADCNSYYVTVCRYSPKGHIAGKMVYKPGPTCTECKSGTTCEEELGLCV
ncbi:unnamed protein product [Cylicocyclus nassatus]|uniref:SCP domain-containing protein n=1 Tax=Cylicocyclus nassatus TaxID=53992 RepID=A0AA36H030_CYLNA|nr:unnamed protein product [Cylicocyclus nassatus]